MTAIARALTAFCAEQLGAHLILVGPDGAVLWQSAAEITPLDWLNAGRFYDVLDGCTVDAGRILGGTFSGAMRSTSSGKTRVWDVAHHALPDGMRMISIRDSTELSRLRTGAAHLARQLSTAQAFDTHLHDLTNQIAGLRIGLLNLSRGAGPQQMTELLASIERSFDIVDALRSGTPLLKRSATIVDLNTALDRIVGNCPKPGIRLSTAPPGGTTVVAGPGEIETAYLQLLSSGMSAPAPADLSVSHTEDTISLDLRFTPDVGATAFAAGWHDPFPTMAQLAGGAAARMLLDDLARQGSGSLTLQEDVGAIRVTLTLARGRAPPIPQPSPDLTGLQVLLVEPDRLLAQTIAEALRIAGAKARADTAFDPALGDRADVVIGPASLPLEPDRHLVLDSQPTQPAAPPKWFVTYPLSRDAILITVAAMRAHQDKRARS